MAVRGQYDNPRQNKTGAFKGGVGGTVASKPKKMQSDIRGGRTPGANPKENKSGAFKGGVGGSVANTPLKPTGVRGAGARNVDTKAPTEKPAPRGDASEGVRESVAAAQALAAQVTQGQDGEKKAPAPPGSLNYFMKKAGGRKNAAYQMYKNYKRDQKPKPGRAGS